MEVNVTTKNDRAIMTLRGRFDFNSHRDFRGSYDEILKAGNIKTLEVDMSSVDYLDSSALGMLLLLKERASSVKIELELSHCQGMVKQVLDVANFGKIFKIT